MKKVILTVLVGLALTGCNEDSTQDKFIGSWSEMKGHVKEKWGKLTDDDISQIEGKYNVLSGKLQKLYGLTKEEANEKLNEFLENNKN